MLDRLNPWQRFWGLFALVMLASTLVLAVAIWPSADRDLIADLSAADCAGWRDRSDGIFPEAPAPVAEPCHALRSFLAQHRVQLRTVADYDAWRLRTGIKNVVNVILFWAGSVAALYLFGWAGASVSGRFLRRQQVQATASDLPSGVEPRDSKG